MDLRVPSSKRRVTSDCGEEQLLNIAGHYDTGHDRWIQLDGRRKHQLVGKRQYIEIVAEVLDGATMSRLTERSRMAFAIAADAAVIVPALIGEKDISAGIEFRLCASLKATPQRGKRG
jgi:hypothetical protein